MACWSSKGVSAWPAGRPSPACLNTRTFVLTSASTHVPSPREAWYTNNVSRRGATVQSHLTSLPEVYEAQEVFAEPDPFPLIPLICALDGIQR